MTRSRLTALLTAALVLLAALVGAVAPAASAASAGSPVPTAPTARSTPTAAAAPTPRPVVVVGTGGVTWSDVSPAATPALWSLLQDGASASLTVRSVHSNTCPVDGWLTLSAGERAGDRDTGADSRPACRALREPAADGAVPGWATYRRIAAGKDFDARLGLLGDELARGGGCVRPIGPGAALAAATSAGTVTGYAPYDARTLRTQLGGLPRLRRRRRRGARPGRRGPGGRGAPARVAGRAGPGGRRPGRAGPGRGTGRRRRAGREPVRRR